MTFFIKVWGIFNTKIILKCHRLEIVKQTKNAFSLTWSNLFELTSAPLTVAPPQGAFDILRKFPSRMVAKIVSSKKFFEYSFLGTRWYCRTDLSNSVSWVSVVTRFGSSLAKASLVGANMVYGPSPEMVSFKSTSAKSLSKVVAFSSSRRPACSSKKWTKNYYSQICLQWHKKQKVLPFTGCHFS